MQVHLLLLAILVIINLIPDSFIDRKKYILPISFLLILAYWAFRYNYGLDYWDYYTSFYEGTEGKLTRGLGERAYYTFTSFFSKFYQVIIAQSVIVIASLYHLVRKYIPSNCYWLFFLLFFLTPRFHFVLISALRNSFAVCIMYWAFDLCYISKNRWILFTLLVFVATLFHTTAIAFIVFPFFHLIISRFRGKAIFVGLIVLDVLSLFIVSDFFQYVISLSSFVETYDSYNDAVQNSNLLGAVIKSIILFPTYFLCKTYDMQNSQTKEQKVFILAFFFLSIDLFGINFGGRFTLYLFVFFIIALSITYQYYKKGRLTLFAPYFILVLYTFHNYYIRLSTELLSHEGNYLFYHTIFEASQLP